MTRYLTTGDVLGIAEEVGGVSELRDFGLLDSAVARPQASVFGQDAYPDIWTKAAALMQSLVSNHPFVDGNKRVGLTATMAFLDLNGIDAQAIDEEAAYDLTIGVASGKFTAVEEIAGLLRAVLGS